MTALFFQLVAQYGGLFVFAATFLSCVAMPMPAAFVMLAGGAFAASGDLSLPVVALSALAGAVLGDQAGYWGAGFLRGWLVGVAGRSKTLTRMLEKARLLLERRGLLAVFLSRWLFSPLGPYVNFMAGAAGQAYDRFTLASLAGEAVWVALYVGLGYGFASNIGVLAEVLGDTSGLLAAGLLTLFIGVALVRNARRMHAMRRNDERSASPVNQPD